MRPIFTAVLLALLSTGCSSVQLAYNSADFFIERYANDYLSLDAAQRRDWSPLLEAALERHRAEELPYLAAFFKQAARDARAGFTPSTVDCLLDQFETLYRRHFRLAAATAAPLLANLSPAQIDALAKTFAEEHEEDAAEANAEDAARRARKRAERYVDNLRWWFGDLSSEQRGLVRDITRRIPDTAPAWYGYRHAQRETLIALLRSNASTVAIKQFLIQWLVDFQDLPGSLAEAQPALRTAFADLLLRLQPTLSDEQRKRFIGRLEGLQRDFMRLQQTPTLAPLRCSGGWAAIPACTCLGVLPVMLDTRIGQHRAIRAQVAEQCDEQRVLGDIRNDIKLAEAFATGQPVRVYAPRSRGQQDYQAAFDAIKACLRTGVG